MAEPLNPVATHHLPFFIVAPGQTDVLMVVTAVILGLAVFGFGILFLRLHSLPERVAHKGHKIQFEIVAILGLLALFTHMHIFWVLGLLLAFIDIPEFGGFLSRIAGSVERMAGLKPGAGAEDVVQSGTVPDLPVEDAMADRQETSGVPTTKKKSTGTMGTRKEVDHV
jgi:hypothetical protein